MSPMPTPEYEQHLQDKLRWGRRADHEDHYPDRRDDAGDAARNSDRASAADPRLLDQPVGPATLEAMKAHLAFARRFTPWEVEDGLDD